MTKARDLADRTAADITAVTAGTGISISSGAGPIPTVTNTVATGFDAKGDLIVGTGADTFTTLTVGSTAGHVLTVDSATTSGLKWAAVAAGGKVLQVVSTTKTDTFSSASSSYVDVTGLSVSITPAATSSKILVLADIKGNGTPAQNAGFFQLVRGSTAIAIGDTAGNRTRASASAYINDAGQQVTTNVLHLDSPNTTSATTYKIQGLITSGTFYINRSSTDSDSGAFGRLVSSITVIEIGA